MTQPKKTGKMNWAGLNDRSNRDKQTRQDAVVIRTKNSMSRQATCFTAVASLPQNGHSHMQLPLINRRLAAVTSSPQPLTVPSLHVSGDRSNTCADCGLAWTGFRHKLGHAQQQSKAAQYNGHMPAAHYTVQTATVCSFAPAHMPKHGPACALRSTILNLLQFKTADQQHCL